MTKTPDATALLLRRLRDKQQQLRAEADACEQAIAVVLDIDKQARRGQQLVVAVTNGRLGRRPLDPNGARGRKAAGTRPIDILRQRFAASNGHPITDETIATWGLGSNRLVGVVLSSLRRQKVIRPTAKGWVATGKGGRATRGSGFVVPAPK